MSFKSYASSKGIYEIEEINKAKCEIFTNEIIFDHINLIFDLHERLKGCEVPLTNLANKMVEDFRVAKFFLKEDIEKYKINPKNEFENKVIEFGQVNLYRIERILSLISSVNYENLILRSLRRREICIYNVNLNDIQMKMNSLIYVKNLNEFCENILEYDYIKLFTKIKRSSKEIDFMKCCAYVCSKERFTSDSYNFILACVSFPYEFIRVVSKYRDLGRELSDYYFECDFENVFKKDGKSLV